jgi:hypothetical protein
VARILDGEVGDGYMFGGNVAYRDQAELEKLSGVFDLLPLLPPEVVTWLLDRGRYRDLPAPWGMRQLGALALAIRGEPATREHMRHVFATVTGAVSGGVRARWRRAVA